MKEINASETLHRVPNTQHTQEIILSALLFHLASYSHSNKLYLCQEDKLFPTLCFEAQHKEISALQLSVG